MAAVLHCSRSVAYSKSLFSDLTHASVTSSNATPIFSHPLPPATGNYWTISLFWFWLLCLPFWLRLLYPIQNVGTPLDLGLDLCPPPHIPCFYLHPLIPDQLIWKHTHLPSWSLLNLDLPAVFHHFNLEESSLTISCPLSPMVHKLPNLVNSSLMNLNSVFSVSAIQLVWYFIITSYSGYLK